MGEYAFRDYIDNFFMLSFLALLALTIIKIVLFIANAPKDKGILLQDEQGNEYRAYKLNKKDRDGSQLFDDDDISDPSNPLSWHHD